MLTVSENQSSPWGFNEQPQKPSYYTSGAGYLLRCLYTSILSWWVQLQHYLRQKVLGINAAMKHAFKDVFRFVTFLFIISCFLWWGRSSGVPLLRQTLKSHTIPPGLVGRHFQGSPGPKPCSKQGHSKFLISQPKILLLLSRNQHKHSNWISLGAKSADWGWGHRVCSSFVTDKVVWGQPNLCLSPAS